MQEKDRINEKFHAQKYYTIQRLNIFNSENNLNFQQKSQRSFTGTKRSSNFGTSNKSSKELNQNDSNKKLKNSEESDQNVSSSEVDSSSSCSLDSETSDDSRPAPTSSKRNLNTKSKRRIVNTSQHERKNQSKVQETSKPSLDFPESSKIWTRSQTREQQLEIMKYWLDKYYNQNRFDPTISDLTSGKPWNEIEGKLLSRFMPVFKRYLLDHGLSSRIAEFYFLFFTALRDKHKIATNKNFPVEVEILGILQNDN